MPRQLALLFCAIQFLTRLPVPASENFEADWISRSAKYFPIAGQIVGVLSAGVLLMAAQFWTGWIPPLMAVASGILITGAFHEDGLADTADGLGGGQNRPQRLAIMKDSRVGTYGVLAVVLCLFFKTAALTHLSPTEAALALVLAHGAARAMAVIVMHVLPYVGDAEAAKVRQSPNNVTLPECLIAVMLGLWPLVFLPLQQVFCGILVGGLAAVYIARTASRLIGGQTGDVLGAVEQVFEVGFLLGVTSLFPVVP